jgi:hypothetical protein
MYDAISTDGIGSEVSSPRDLRLGFFDGLMFSCALKLNSLSAVVLAVSAERAAYCRT